MQLVLVVMMNKLLCYHTWPKSEVNIDFSCLIYTIYNVCMVRAGNFGRKLQATISDSPIS